MPKQILFNEEARTALLRGINIMSHAVKVTLGPKGRNVAIPRKFGRPTITKDGVTVATDITLRDPNKDLGARMLVEVTAKTSDVAGDGTTTATVLAQAIFREGLKNVIAGANPMGLKRGIERAVDAVVEELKHVSKATQDRSEIAQVGAIAANNDKAIGELIAEAMEKVGTDGAHHGHPEGREGRLADRARRGILTWLRQDATRPLAATRIGPWSDGDRGGQRLRLTAW